MDKPVRVLLEKDGKPFRGPTTCPSARGLPRVGDQWDDKHVVVGGKRGKDDEVFDEVILIVEEKQ